MSETIRGITFAEQSVTPADDAIVRRAILGDGVLTGCDISYSGSTLTMAAGYIIACGRTFQITAAQNWAVVDATSGVARLLLTMDLTKTATEDTFRQIDFSIEYASAADGFVDLIQEDINLSGTKYQIVVAVVSLGTGGITGIVSKLERTEGGGGLNFRVVDGLTQPGDPKENMIWVYTEGMTGWYMQPTKPENMQPGEVWISTGTGSSVSFNVLKKNSIMVYPISAQQNINGEIKGVTATIYQNGNWRPWIAYLYDKGNEYEDFTGGWTISGIGKKEAERIYLGQDQKYAAQDNKATTNNKFNFSGSEIIEVHFGYFSSTTSSGYCEVRLVDDDNNIAASKTHSYSDGNDVNDFVLTLQSTPGEYYVQVVTGQTTADRATYAHFNFARY